MTDLVVVPQPGDPLARPCGKRCGPVWKLDGEVCVCIEPAGHVERKDGKFGADHLCSCGAWFVDEVARD